MEFFKMLFFLKFKKVHFFIIISIFSFLLEGKAQTTITLGNGTSSNSSTSYPAPYGNFYWGAKHQMLIKASELNAQGLGAGDITALGFNVANPNGVQLKNFRIGLKQTSVSNLSNFQSGFNTVYGPLDYTESSGWNMHNFSTSFYWDGSSNIVVETCFNNSSWTNNAAIYYTTTSFNSTLYYRSDQTGVCPSPGGPTSSTSRPNMQISWTPANVPPDADFTVNANYTCTGQVQFTDQSINQPTSWKWYFGDGDSSSTQNPSHTYSSNGTYTVELIATNSFGSDTITKTNYITVNIGNAPQAVNCTPSTQNSQPGFGVQEFEFNNIQNPSQDAATEGYADFTCLQTDVYEGATYTMNIVTDTPTTHHTRAWIDYNDDGSFSDPGERVASASSQLSVSQNVTIPSTAVLNSPLRLRVIADYDVGNPMPLPCTDPQYGQAEDYTINILPNTLPPEADFTVDDTITCDGTVQFTDLSANVPDNWSWDFGDGTGSSAQDPSHTYTSSGTYTVQLIVYKGGNSDTATYTNLVNVDLSGAPTATSCSPSTLGYCCDYGIYQVSYNNLNSFTGDASEGYRDLSCSRGTHVTPGISYNLFIKTGPNNPQDTKVWVDLDSNGVFANPGELVFEAYNTTDPSGSFAIPNGTPYGTPLRMRVISDEVGASISPCNDPTRGQAEDYKIIVDSTTNPPVAEFLANKTTSCDSTISFTDQSSNGPSSWKWYFGDGTTSTQQNPTHTYPGQGTYYVALKVTNNVGTDSLMKTNYITISNSICDSVKLPNSGAGQTANSCNGFITDDGGRFLDYSNSTDGWATIAPSGATSVTLDFNSFSFESGFDSLYIYDGPGINSPLIGGYSGSLLPGGGSITSSGGALTLRQVTDGSLNLSGFTADWSCTTGIQDKETSDVQLKVFPNPSDQNVSIVLTGQLNPPYSLEIKDMLGKVVRESTIESNAHYEDKIPVQDLHGGIYTLLIRNDQHTSIKKVLIQH